MKTKFFVLVFMLMFGVMIIPQGSALKADGAFSSTLPSEKYYEQEKGYLNSSSSMSRYASVSMMAKNADAFGMSGELVDNLAGPPTEGDSGGGYVGAPIGDVTPAVILVMLVMYTLFRRATTSRRKNL